MGHTSVLPQYIVKAFVEPVSQCKITGHHSDHWHSDLMVGLYCVHQYSAICKENVKESRTVPSRPLRDTALCAVTLQEITPVLTTTSEHITASYWSAVTTSVLL